MRHITLDEKDMDILIALNKLGGSASAPEVSEFLLESNGQKIPARTVRYRISVLQERGILLPPYLETHERRLGLGEGILVLQESRGRSGHLEELINEIPIFYWHVPTHGKHDGYLVHIVHDLSMPGMIDRLAETLLESGFIDAYSFFDMADYESKSVDFSHYDPEEGWSWNWERWYKKIESHLERNPESPVKVKVSKEIMDCDYIDIQVLKLLKMDPSRSVRDVASEVGVSTAQVRDRIQRMRESGVIRGQKRAYGLADDLLWISCFFEIDGPVGGVLTSFSQLPFPGGILMENPKKYCVRFGFSTTDLKQFLEGFKRLRPYMRSYFFQFHLPDRSETTYYDVFDLFDQAKNQWSIPIDDYVSLIGQRGRSKKAVKMYE
ncbi:MAG: winged helix-turn-helix transcriptional regulator [Candidatus Thorarchaeota archaeon]|nr:MAG: winged helix-turn-helix transcriptional regulator [Candidatus Thorarchaeota archaeon]